uniref:Uncharacterized protein n=1 Tax=Rhizophora mucronata TaxID=61149 RepID=A0A2P2QEG6_RHIMU
MPHQPCISRLFKVSNHRDHVLQIIWGVPGCSCPTSTHKT